MDATYRLQLHAGFTLVDALRLLPYLENLGISHLYLSPIFAARLGSVHGYDVVDPTRVNPELGGADAFEALADGLQARRMGLILDLVPNHMAADHHNPWWMDVLTHGPASAHARFFDIDWASPQAPTGRVLLPFLGAPLHEVLSRGEIRPVLERPPAPEPPWGEPPIGHRGSAGGPGQAGGPAHADSIREPPPELAFYARYHDRLFPLEPGTWPDVLRAADGPLPPSLETLVRDLEAIPGFRTTDERAAVLRRRTAAGARRTLAHLAATDPAAGEALRRALAALIVRPGAAPGAADAFAGILARQPWLLLHHGEARRRLNYRRFFDITDLIGVRVEDEAVFAITHSLVLDMAERGRIAGVRVDHVDGLLDPTGYLTRLRDQLAERGGRHVPIWVEKILSPGEQLPAEWPVAGTTGYDFLNALGHVFIDAEGLTRLGRFYDDFTGRDEPFSEVRHRCKRLVLTELLGAEMRGLGERLARLSRNDPAARDEGAARGDPAGELLSPAALTEALLQVTASLTVYRTYIRDAAVCERDRVLIDEAVDDAQRRDPGRLTAALEYLRRLLSLRPSLDGPSLDEA
ncbi:MAG TPA: alpha-amylase family glycosyl hydrolase, partial [Thermoleophilia bacterium]|nr:alpha-amylase family glycosyl hydrolase [Thermoleophilia bacterium]